MDGIEQTVKEYILQEFLAGEAADSLTSATPLMTGGVLDSLTALQLVEFLEARYHIEFQAHEVSAEHFNSVASISSLVQSKATRQE